MKLQSNTILCDITQRSLKHEKSKQHCVYGTFEDTASYVDIVSLYLCFYKYFFNDLYFMERKVNYFKVYSHSRALLI